MRVLVTGATGFLGRAMVLRLACDGVAVRGLVRASRDTDSLQRAGVEVAPGDVCDLAAVRDAMRGCSHVIHLAAQKAAPGVSAATQYDVNVRGTANVADAARAEGITRLVYGSTLGVHGFVTRGLIDETSAIRPNTPYRKSKWLGETVAREAHHRHGLPVVVARISTVVGPGARNWLPFARMIQARRIRLIGDGANHLDLVAVDDLIDGLWRCALAPDVDGGCYVLGSGELWTFRTFAETVAHAMRAAAPDRAVPAAPYRAILHVASAVFRATGYHSQFAHGREVLTANKTTSSMHARTDLGYDPSRSVTTAIDAMIAQFLTDGSLSAPGMPRTLQS